MRCPFCGNEDTQVKDSRPSEEGVSIRRRRYCTECDSRFTTFERVQLKELVVVKKDGKRRPFDRDKLVSSIRVAVRKRPITEEQVEMAVNNIVRNLEKTVESEVESDRIGEAVMDVLAELDPVSYIRFASVYKDFTGVQDFQDFAGTIGIIAKEEK
ncbi:MAG: transcriptional regulator NrdR [Alphaproteobacteria bacterium CG11_big_fil_rev_8_21_14_0_20_39_49]|nr:MAG: transcriptional regulator NrdR [Alphaproteobacteria bacterium CG11_big_fil_rev_8_21_14_0_20_39_49]